MPSHARFAGAAKVGKSAAPALLLPLSNDLPEQRHHERIPAMAVLVDRARDTQRGPAVGFLLPVVATFFEERGFAAAVAGFSVAGFSAAGFLADCG